MSKGSKPRPFSVSNEDYANRWDAIFGRDLPKEDKEKMQNMPHDEMVKMAYGIQDVKEKK